LDARHLLACFLRVYPPIGSSTTPLGRHGPAPPSRWPGLGCCVDREACGTTSRIRWPWAVELYAYDRPDDLAQCLVTACLEPEDDEAVMVAELCELDLEMGPLPAGARCCVAADAAFVSSRSAMPSLPSEMYAARVSADGVASFYSGNRPGGSHERSLDCSDRCAGSSGSRRAWPGPFLEAAEFFCPVGLLATGRLFRR
jgi:hypothetical protein